MGGWEGVWAVNCFRGLQGGEGQREGLGLPPEVTQQHKDTGERGSGAQRSKMSRWGRVMRRSKATDRAALP